MRNLDEKIALLTGDLNRMKMDNSRLENQLKSFQSKVSVSELRKKIAAETKEVRQMSDRVQNLKSSNVKVYSNEEKNKVVNLTNC